MSEKEFLEKLTDILDCGEALSIDMQLDDVEEWDSLGIIGFLAEMERYSHAKIKADDVKQARTVSDLFALIK